MRDKIFILCLLFLILSCKKNRDNMIDISGNVTNTINNQPIEGVQVLLEVKELGGTSCHCVVNSLIGSEAIKIEAGCFVLIECMRPEPVFFCT